MQLVLSLFPGIGLLDMAFEEQGFCVVRGPDLLWGGDVQQFRPPAGVFDGVIGGPPCQAWSQLRYMVIQNGIEVAPDLIPEFERCIAEAAPKWFLMENVPSAPIPAIEGYQVDVQLLRDVWVGGETMRLRRFSFGTHEGRRLKVEQLALHRPDPDVSALAGGGARLTPIALGGSGKPKRHGRSGRRSALGQMGYGCRRNLIEHLKLQGLPPGFLEDSPLTVAGKIKAIGNGVPLPMGRAVARAVKLAIEIASAIA